jgi:hypothetical protein
MTEPAFEKITVPLDWTGERDIQEFVNRFGESDDYFGAVLAAVDAGYERLEQALDRKLARAGHSASFTAHITDRVNVLRRAVLAGAPAGFHESPLLQHLDFCRFSLVEYFRLMPAYIRGGDSNWLSPLIRLADHLMAAADGFD